MVERERRDPESSCGVMGRGTKIYGQEIDHQRQGIQCEILTQKPEMEIQKREESSRCGANEHLYFWSLVVTGAFFWEFLGSPPIALRT